MCATATGMDSPQFFQVFLPHHSSKMLKIPVAFVQHMGGRTSGSVHLMGPSGNTWKVNLMEKKDGLFFDQGWPTFVKDHLIGLGEVLLFRYDGNLKFTVTIYGLSACEKEAAFHAECSQPADDIGKEGKKSAVRVKAAATSSCEMLVGDSPKRMDVNSRPKARSETDGCLETVERREAKSFTTKHPFFVACIRKFNLKSCVLHIPSNFLKENLLSYQSNDKMILRNQQGKTGTVNIIKGRSNWSFCAGWGAFACNSNIKERDTCIFELVNKFEMHVHIIQPEKLKSNK